MATVFKEEFGTSSASRGEKQGSGGCVALAAPGDLSRARAGSPGLTEEHTPGFASQSRNLGAPGQAGIGGGPCLFTFSSPHGRLIDRRTVSMARIQ